MEYEIDLAEDEADFGFVWGHNDQFHYLRHPDGDINKVDERLIRDLKEVSETDPPDEEIPEPLEARLDLLAEQGYFFDGPIVELSDPDELRLLPRIGLLALLILVVEPVAILATTRVGWFSDGLFTLSNATLLVGFIALIVHVIFHETGHFIAAKSVGISSKIKLGFLNGVLPAVITESTQLWMLDRNKRIWVNLAGIFSQLVIGVPMVVLYYAHPSPYTAIVLVPIVMLSLFTFNPLIHGDGYQIMMDVLGVMNIRKRGLEHLKSKQVNWYSLYAFLSYAIYPVYVIGANLIALMIIFQEPIRGVVLLSMFGVTWIGSRRQDGIGCFQSHTAQWEEDLDQITNRASSGRENGD